MRHLATSSVCSSDRGTSGNRPCRPLVESLESRTMLAADLVASLSYTAGTYFAGQTLQAAMLNEMNVGDEEADGYATTVLLSTDTTAGNGDDIEIGRFERRSDPITPGSLMRSARTLTITPAMAAGRYFVIVRVDVDGEVSENVEANNVWISPSADVTIAKPSVTMLVTDRTASEAGGNTGRVRFTRSGPLDAALTVRYSVGGTINPTAPNADILPLSGMVTIAAGQSSAVVTITPIDDSLVEGVERAELTLVTDDAYTFAAGAVARVDINDNDGAKVRIAATDSSASEEGTGTGTFTVTRGGSLSGNLLVKYTVSGSATPGDDYAMIGGDVTIPDGQASVTITVTPIDDAVGEAAETVILTLSASPSYLIVASRRTARVTIADNEPTVKIEATDASASEAATGSTGTATYRVTRTGSSAQPVTVLYTVSGTATSGSDFVALPGSVTIPSGSLTATIVMTPIDDAVSEPIETVILTLAAGSGYRIDNARRRATANIADDEPKVSVVASDATATENNRTTGTFTISRTGTPVAELEVRFTLSGTATGGSDYEAIGGIVVIPAGQSSTTVVVTPVDDNVGEGSETVILTLNARNNYSRNPSRTTARITIADNEPSVSIFATDASAAESGGDPNTGTFEVTRTGSTVGALTVGYTVGGTAAKDGADYAVLSGTVTIADGQSRAAITITPVDDAVAEPAETVILTLQTGTGYILSNSRRAATVTIADNEPVVSIAATRASTTEGSSGDTAVGVFTISRAAAAPSSLLVAFTVGGTASEIADYEAIGTSVTIPANETSATVTIRSKQDTRGEGDETVELTLAESPDYTALTTDRRNTARVTIRDDEPKVSIAATDSTATETDETDAVFTLTRTGTEAQLAETLTVRYRVEGTADPGDDYEALDGEVTFAAGAATATIYVTAIDDDLGESTETVIVTVETDDESEYMVDSARASASVSITDNEPVVSVAATTAAASENNRPGAFTIRRTGSSAEDLEVSYTVGGTATSGADYAALAGTVTIPAGQTSATINITPVYDLLTEENETVILTLTAGPGYRVDTARAATVTIANAQAVDLNLLSVSYFGRSYSLASTGAGSPIAVNLRNMGLVSSGGFNVEFRLSTNTTWGDEDDVVIGSMAAASVAGGGSSTIVFDFAFDGVKSRLETGAYYLACRIDPLGRVAEASKSNNTYFSSSPDIVVTD